ncbi:hypothetical protein SPSIL_003520 [Sporomusa silvacetica DSM 10669]|uniref:Uncharacterized protein n=1 Tax=Sporomusa silvacetica DSM 10669 TaxID=1123289 RepID=A0ABZ3IF34_9FIRM|nr:hypothetical protein SPSIL_28860 [Sporomusa silvacetica DSM 10669]
MSMSIRQTEIFFVKLLLLLLVLCTVPFPAFAIKPINVAVLPPINTATFRYLDDIQVIQNTIIKPFKYPYYSLLPADAVQKAAKTYLAEHKTSRLTDEKVMAELATNLSADLVVVVELSQVWQDRVHTFGFDETYIESDIVLKCYAYSSLLNRIDMIKVVKYDRESESIDTNIDIIFKDLTAQMLVKLPYKRIPLAGFEKPDPLPSN